MHRNNVNYLLFLILALFWSGSFLGIKIVVDHFPPFFSGMMRVAIAQCFLTIYFLVARKPVFADFSVCWRLWVVGIFSQGLPFALLFYGEQTVEPALASILNSTSSIWALIIGVIALRDMTQLTLIKVAGLIIGLLGVTAIFWPMLHNAHGHSTLIGTVAILGMAISYAIGALLNQHFVAVKLRPAFQVSLWQQHWASIVFLLLLSALFEPRPEWHYLMHKETWGALLYLGLFSTAIAWVIYYHLIREWDAVRASSVMYIVPLLAIIWDYLFLHLKPSLIELVGVVTILLGVTMIQLPAKTVKTSF